MKDKKLEMPKGYTLIRYGLFRWGWRREDVLHASMVTKMTAAEAMRYAILHSEIMGDNDK